MTPAEITRQALAVLCVNPFGLTDEELADRTARADEVCECCGQPLTEFA